MHTQINMFHREDDAAQNPDAASFIHSFILWRLIHPPGQVRVSSKEESEWGCFCNIGFRILHVFDKREQKVDSCVL